MNLVHLLCYISGYNKISIININYYELLREIEIPNSIWINGACILNKNIFFLKKYLLRNKNDNTYFFKSLIIKEFKLKNDKYINLHLFSINYT